MFRNQGSGPRLESRCVGVCALRLTFIRPMEPELVEQPPKGDGWSHEVKFDGYRTQLVKDENGIRLYTKSGIDWTSKYRPTAAEAAKLQAESHRGRDDRHQ